MTNLEIVLFHVHRLSSLPDTLEYVYRKKSHTAIRPPSVSISAADDLSVQELNMQQIHRADLAALTTTLWNWPTIGPVRRSANLVSRLVKVDLRLAIPRRKRHAKCRTCG